MTRQALLQYHRAQIPAQCGWRSTGLYWEHWWLKEKSVLTTASLFEALRILLLLTLYLTAWKTEEGLVLEQWGWAPPALLGLPPRKDSGRILEGFWAGCSQALWLWLLRCLLLLISYFLSTSLLEREGTASSEASISLVCIYISHK